jgi:hypothetical protein
MHRSGFAKTVFIFPSRVIDLGRSLVAPSQCKKQALQIGRALGGSGARDSASYALGRRSTQGLREAENALSLP